MESEDAPLAPQGVPAGFPDDHDIEGPPGSLHDVAPAVVAVVVTHDSGPWLEDCLAALRTQDYPNLSVLVVDSGSADDITARVAAVLPSAYVRRLDQNVGFGPAANEVLGMVEGASHYVFCHDDVAPAPDAVRMLVEEAFRSNAGIVAPKLVAWDAPERLLSVGMQADKSGVSATVVEPGEIDQEQHDAVRDIFLAPGGCTLVRADLFATLGGFDRLIVAMGEDLDLSWRTQVVGARVVVAPAARVRHLEAMTSGLRPPPPATGRRAPGGRQGRIEQFAVRHRLRTVLVCYSLGHLVRVLPQIVVLNLGELIYALSTGRKSTAAAVAGAWQWNLAHLSDIRHARAGVRQVRSLGDGDVRRSQVRGSARITAFMRSRLGPGAESRLWDTSRRRLSESVPSGRAGVAVWTVLVLTLVVGTRGLLFGALPEVGDFVRFPDRPADFLRQYLSGWRLAGLGSEAPAPAAFGLLGLAGLALGGAMGLLQKILVLGALPAGVIGIYRMARPLSSPRARLVAVIVYAAIPLPYTALASGSWSGLIAYGVAPWVMHRMLVATRLEPFVGRVRPVWPTGLRLGLVFAVIGALAPSLLVVFVVVAGLVALSGLVAGPVRLAGQALPRVLVASGVAVVLLFPWSLDLLAPGGSWTGIFGAARPEYGGLALGQAMRFHMGEFDWPGYGWAFPLAAALPLLVGRGWRLAWAGRLWVVAIGCWVVAWAGGRGWIGIPVPTPEIWLAPAAVAVAMSAALGLVAFQLDLPGYRFGWRQAASAVAAGAVIAGAVPLLGGALDGRWDAGNRDFASALSWMAEQRTEGDFRVLWLGDPAVLPLEGWPAGGGVAYATSRNGTPDATALWAPAHEGSTGLLADSIGLARREGTTRVGHLLAPMAVRYVVVVRQPAPGRSESEAVVPPDLLAGLRAQIDLRLISEDDAMLVYENAAWTPARAQFDAAQLEASDSSGIESASEAELSGAAPVLRPADSPFRFRGRVAAGAGGVYHAEAAGAGWSLEVAGERAERRPGFGWAMAYPDPGEGAAVLRYRTGALRYVALVLQLALWMTAVVLVRRSRFSGTHAPRGLAP